MPRVSDEELSASEILFRPHGFGAENKVYRIVLDLQDSRAALQAIINWKRRATDEPPLTFIERMAKEMVG